ncbi:hypothetical protein BH09GEM1_BH09GEM1_30490 [soil metagenome]
MLTSNEREKFALQVMTEVRRWSGVEMHPHPSPDRPGDQDGVEFRYAGRQIGHMHDTCAVHLSLTKALKQSVVGEGLAEPLTTSPDSGWAMFNPEIPADVDRAIWLLRLNYVRFRRQRLTLDASAASALLQEHEAALATVSSGVATVLKRTQRRSKPRPLPELPAP